MISIILNGGIGNILFQVFSTIATSIQTGHDVKFMFVPKNNTTRPSHWHDALKHIVSDMTTTRIELENVSIETIIRGKCQYSPIVISDEYNNNTSLFILSGCFQSDLYFRKEFDIISGRIGIQKMRDEVYNDIIYESKDGTFAFTKESSIILPLNTSIDNSISIHFRMGDYKLYTHCHPVIPYDYYANSLEFILNRLDSGILYLPSIFYFCEEEDIENVEHIILKLSKKFPLVYFSRISNKKISDWKQLLLMSLCTHNIIANSTFSWWAAYINNYKEKVICFPHLWVGPSMPINTSDICPREWFCMDENPGKCIPIPIEDRTFYIE